MTTTADVLSRAELEQAMRNITETLHRMPAHWVDKRAALHYKLDDLLTDWQVAGLEDAAAD